MLKRLLKDLPLLLVGCLLVALGLDLFLIPHKIVAGGLSGLATVLYHLFGLPVGTVMFLLNVPLLLVGLRILGPLPIGKTLLATFLLAVMIDFFEYLDLPQFDDLLLSSLFGGILTGAGLGLLLRRKISTGGTDLLSQILHVRGIPLSLGKLLLIVDVSITFIAVVVFRDYALGLYATVTIYVAARVIDSIVGGVNYAKAAYIISQKEKADAITSRILRDLDRGVTRLYGEGGYTGDKKEVLLCVIDNRALLSLKRIVMEEDSEAFVFFANVREVVGIGFSRGSP